MESGMERVRLGRAWAHLHFPYLATALHSMTLIESDSVPSMGVDPKWRCYWNARKVEEWSIAEVGSVLIHEVWHCLRKHAERALAIRVLAGEREVWNAGADLEINDDMTLDSLIQLPGGPLLPKQLDLPGGKLAEFYFRELLRRAVRIVAVFGGSCADGQTREWEEQGEQADVRWGPGVSPDEAELIAHEVAAQVLVRMRTGKVPQGVSRWAAEVLAPPKVRWQSEALSQIRSCCAHVAGCWDYTYRRLSRRQAVARDLVLTGMHKPVPEIAAVIDTSGSMSDAACGVAVNELSSLLRQVGCPVRVLSVDAALHHVQKAFGRVDRKLFGGGGTDMALGIQSAERLFPRPDLIVVLTDCCTGWPLTRPHAPVIVAKIGLHKSSAPPGWSRVIEVPADELKDEDAVLI